MVRRDKIKCIYCSKEVEGFIEYFIYRCEKFSDLETIYECTSYTCGLFFSRSETDFPANQCPYCGWPYGRLYTRYACPKCWSNHNEISQCKEGLIILCPECNKWFFTYK